jgi:transposase
MDKRSLISDLRTKKADAQGRTAAMLANSRGRAMTSAETAILADRLQEIEALGERIAELEEQVRAHEAAVEIERRYAPPVGWR